MPCLKPFISITPQVGFSEGTSSVPQGSPAPFQQRYRVGEELGRGGMGVVYRAHDTLLERDVAVKVLDKAALGSEGRARLLREARSIARLNHPNIVTVHDAGELEGAPFLVMELVEGQTLRQKLAATLEEKLRWMVQVCAALTHAHQHGILHRDLKPENVFVSEDGRVRLADFGLARRFDTQHLTQSGMLVGTPAYISPEQLRGEELDARSDLYALGVMLYELVTGRLPFEGDTLMALLAQHLQARATPPNQYNPTLPPALNDLILRLLSKQPGERPETAQVVGEALEKLLQPAAPTGEQKPESRHNLPLQLTAFIGREAELAHIARLLADPQVRLLTILGSGGVGKTRLALEAAQRQLGSFSHGVFFVSLAALASIESIVSAIADAMGFSFYQGSPPRQQLLSYLARKETLLVMDNYEHLLEGADVVTDILTTAPRVKVLATSRSRLNLEGEQRFQLAGMDFPTPISQEVKPLENALQLSSVRLFMQGTQHARPGYELEAEDLQQVVRICRLLGGIPLAIRLAAAWVELLSPRRIADEIEKSLDFLETDRRDVPRRQRSMRAVFDHSWNLLSEGERRVLAGLSVFRGGFKLEAAQAVTGASLRELMKLIDRSLVQREAGERYTLHELLRLYASEKLAEDPAWQQHARERHSAYYGGMLQRWGGELKSAAQVGALNAMDVEIENCRAAWGWAVELGQVRWIRDGMPAMFLFHYWRRRIPEGVGVFRSAGAMLADAAGSEPLPVLAETLFWQAILVFERGDNEAIQAILHQGQHLLENTQWVEADRNLAGAYVLFVEAVWVYNQGNVQRAFEKGEACLEVMREAGEPWMVAIVLFYDSGLAFGVGKYALTQKWAEESLKIFRSLGEPRGIAYALTSLGDDLVALGRVQEGEGFLRESIAILRQVGEQNFLALALKDLGVTLAYYEGRFSEAHDLLEESIRRYQESENERFLAWSLSVQGYMKLALGDYRGGRTRFHDSLVLARKTKDLTMTGYSLWHLGICELLEQKDGEAQRLIQEAVTDYQEALIENQVGALTWLAIVLTMQDDLSQAQHYICEALQIGLNRYGDNITNLTDVLPGVALYLAGQGQAERAVELWALAVERSPFIANARHLEDLVGKHVRAAAGGLPAEVATAAEARGRARDPWQTARELLAELEKDDAKK